MNWKTTIVMAVCAILVAYAGIASATGIDSKLLNRVPNPNAGAAPSGERSGARLETLWIFDADFSTLTGDNAGWTVYDRSGTLACTNYWHHDTIHMWNQSPSHPLGDSTWWCGTYNSCWRQPRGYANDWLQMLERHFTEASGSAPGADMRLEYDQRYAIENDYDYGYVDIRSSATADTWFTLVTISNPGFAGTPGRSQDWNSVHPEGPGHMVVDLAGRAADEFDLRFRFESDQAYSSQDQWNNPPFNSCFDGAWQLDNITLYVDDVPVFTDDAESDGQNGWITDDSPAAGQVGVTFWRGQFGYDFETGRAFTCDDRPLGSWMYAAVDPFTSKMVDDQYSWIMSPPINVSGAGKLVGQWDQWVDLPEPSGDYFDLLLASDDNEECVTDPSGFADEEPGGWFGGPFWGIWDDDWDAFAGNDWLAIVWEVANDTEGTVPHMAGMFYNRQRVGIPSGDAGTVFEVDFWNDFHDWFQEQITEALADTGRIMVDDDDGVVSVTMIASNDDGATWSAYDCRKETEAGNWWLFPPPTDLIVPGSEIHFYFTSVDGVGNSAIDPDDAPDHYYEFSILPLNATVAAPGILLVDKHERPLPGEDRRGGGLNYERPLTRYHSQFYYQEMLDILGYDWEIFDVDVESANNNQSDGPDSSGYKYYDTQIWFTSEFDVHIIDPVDQQNLVDWLAQAGGGVERNLLMTGNDIGYELMEVGRETMSFYETWLASTYLDNSVGSITVDSLPTVRDAAGGHDFMTYDDGAVMLRGSCPVLSYFDVVDVRPGLPGNEIVAEYVKQDASTRPAGVAYTNPTLGYQTVNLGFGMEFMVDGKHASRTPGYFYTGIEDRVNLLSNIMDYFDRPASGPGTGVVDVGSRNALSLAHPNPFNPMTRIEYSVQEAGPVTIEVFNVAGKVVRTLLATESNAGASGYVVWDGTADSGEKCASGVYFYRIAAPGFTATHKMIMLK
jgi:hypothetical protein